MPLLVGPFTQILSLDNLPDKGPIANNDLEVITAGGMIIQNGLISAVGEYNKLFKEKNSETQVVHFDYPTVAIPGIIDCHTHLCYGGNRVADYTLRSEGRSYEDIAAAGGGIQTSVQATRGLLESELYDISLKRRNYLKSQGITTVEVKSGYGLNFDSEIKMLRVIKRLDEDGSINCIPTCLAAHTIPKEFANHASEYLAFVTREILPSVLEEQLSKRVDIFIEKGAFAPSQARNYLQNARRLGFDLTVHADQFSRGGSQLAAQMNCVSADHLEASEDEDIQALAKSDTVAVVLPGASLGLGMHFAPARKLLDAGCCVAIASDFNPGSAPMGQLVTQASLIGIYQKLTMAELLAGITFRSAKALNLADRGKIKPGLKADVTIFPTDDLVFCTVRASVNPVNDMSKIEDSSRI